MLLENIIIVVLLILLIYLVFIKYQIKSKINNSSEPKPISDDTNIKKYEIDWDKLTDGEKVQYLADYYFKTSDDEIETTENDSDTKFINSLPVNDNCNDEYTDCSKWADDGECKINPEFMLYNCQKSCKSCQLSLAEKYKLTEIYNKTKPIHCVYHGANYPDIFRYLNRIYDYTNPATY